MAGVMPQQPTVPFPFPVPVTPTTTTTSTVNPFMASSSNSLRVSTVMEQFKLCLQETAASFNPGDFCSLCLCLARGIDYAVANSEILPRASEMPSLFKQVYQRRSEDSLRAAILLLMISVKGACKSGWFTARDADELLKLTDELGSLFYSTGSIQPESSNASMISKIVSRYYPKMKLGHILASLEIKPGYGAYATDVVIPKQLMTGDEKIYLFVAQTGNIETSSCIVNPPLVSFLLNGRGVNGRTNISMDNGPQFPTNVMSVLRYGTNLLQAIGPFNGDYVVAVVVMSEISSSEVPVLQDYVRPLVAAHDSDTDIIEGSSRISINCPISLKHIKTPVKGHLCKHHQCFDYDNFVEINLRRPSWRCPQCSQSVCYTDIRVDQFMAKVLREVGDTVTEVIISTDGSFEPVSENGCQQDMSQEPEFPKSAGSIVDLTTGDAPDTWEIEDRKPAVEILQSLTFTSTNTTPPLEVNGTYQDAAPHVGDIWAGILSACSNSFGMSTGVSDYPSADSVMSSAPRDIVALTLDRVTGVSSGGPTQNSGVSLRQNQFSSPINTQFQPSPIGYPIVQGGVGAALTRNVTRIPMQVHALPTRNFVNTTENSLMQNTPVASDTSFSRAPIRFNTGGNVTETRQLSVNHPQPSGTASTVMLQHLLSQNSFQYNMNVPSFSPQQTVGLPATTQVPNSQGVFSGASSEQINSHHQHPSNIRVSQQRTSQLPNMSVGPFTSHFTNQWVPVSTSQPSIAVGTPNNFVQRRQPAYQSSPRFATSPYSTVAPSSHIPQPNIQRGSQCSNSQHAPESSSSMQSRLTATAQRASSMARAPPVKPVQLEPSRVGSNPVVVTTVGPNYGTSVGEQRTRGTTGGVVQSVSRTEDLVQFSQEQSDPARRMRGSLAGRAFPAQYVIQPTQGVQQARPAPPILSAQSAVHQPVYHVE